MFKFFVLAFKALHNLTISFHLCFHSFLLGKRVTQDPGSFACLLCLFFLLFLSHFFLHNGFLVSTWYLQIFSPHKINIIYTASLCSLQVPSPRAPHSSALGSRKSLIRGTQVSRVRVLLPQRHYGPSLSVPVTRLWESQPCPPLPFVPTGKLATCVSQVGTASRPSHPHPPPPTPARSRPYSCSVCGKRFSLKHQMETHHRVHTGMGVLPCANCFLPNSSGLAPKSL